MSESTVVHDILRTIGSRPDVRLWRVNVGVATYGKHTVRFGVPGMADLSGILPDGRRLEIECKSPTGKQRKEQAAFQTMIERFGGVYILARSAEQALTTLQRYGYCRELRS